MAVELFVKRLLAQAGVAVLTGVLLSSAVMAEDASDAVSDGGPDVSIDDGAAIGDGDGGDVGYELGDNGAEEGTVEGTDEGTDEGEIPEVTECGFELVEFEVPEVVIEGPVDFEVVDPGCIDCSTGLEVPTDVTIDPIELTSDNSVDLPVEATSNTDAPLFSQVQRELEGRDSDAVLPWHLKRQLTN